MKTASICQNQKWACKDNQTCTDYNLKFDKLKNSRNALLRPAPARSRCPHALGNAFSGLDSLPDEFQRLIKPFPAARASHSELARDDAAAAANSYRSPIHA